MVTKAELMNISLHLLGYVGVNPNQNFKYMYVAICNNFLRILNMFMVMRLMVNNMDDVNIFMDSMGALSTFLQGFVKLLPFLVFRKDSQFLINNLDIIDRNTGKIKDFKFWKKALVFYQYFLFSALGSVISASIITQKMAFPSYIPDFPHARAVLTICQYIQLSIDGVVVIAGDMYFISVCLIITQDFKELKQRFMKIDEETDSSLLQLRYKECVEGHVDLLNYAARLANSFSITLLVQYMISMYTICIELYVLTEKANVSDIIPGLLYIVSLLFQMSVYCFPAEEITHMAAEIGLFIYQSEWYKHSKSLQKDVSFIVQRAQRPFYFMAGGMLIINREAFTNIFKGSLSFYTLVKNVKE